MTASDLTPLLDKVLAAEPLAPADRLAALRKLDAWLAHHGPLLDPQLRHYLERRSYLKARAWEKSISSKDEPTADEIGRASCRERVYPRV